MPKKKKIINEEITYLVCINKEEYSKVAVSFAYKLAKRNNGRITLLNVIEPSDYQSFGAVADKMQEEMRKETEELFQQMSDEITSDGGNVPILIVKEGRIEEEIINVVEEDPMIRMIIVGTATESSVKSKVLPPLVTQIGNKLLIPMLIVPGNLTDQQIDSLT
ncbi:universal stress protein [Rickettsiales bacterium]|nr:universal stress protein [Rickettsiales bacterium]